MNAATSVKGRIVAGFGGSQFSIRTQTLADAAQHVVKETVEQALGADADRLDLTTDVMRGPASLALVRLSAEALMVVVGCRGRVRGLVSASVSRHVAEHAECPVLVMHTHEREG